MSDRILIYDAIPIIEKRLVSLLRDFLSADEGKLYSWEMAVFIPACNVFIHNMSGVNESLRSDNYISAITNLRSAIESLAVVAYDGTAKLTEDQYRRFIKKGRFCKKEDGRWTEIGPRSMVREAEKVLGIKLVKTYDECSSIVHFSSNHMRFLGRLTDKKDVGGNNTEIVIGSKDKIPVEVQKNLIDSTVQLATQLGRCIVAATNEKTERANDSN